MTADATAAPATPAATRANGQLPRLRPGWITIAGKEFTDHLLSVRLYVLLIILGIAALIPLYFAAETIRSLAEQASGQSAVFLALFTLAPQNVDILRVDSFVGIVAPLLGIGFAFDAVNGERHQGTLPRLLSQPIHRDDVINGKFAAGLGIISLALVCMLALISGFGMLRLGIEPAGSEVVRLISWLGLTILYVALWLAFGMLLSVAMRRAATSALVGLGVWLFVAVPQFGQFLVSIIGAVVAPAGTTAQDQLSAAGTQQFLLRLLPSTLYREASVVLLNPTVSAVTTPATLDQYTQYQQQIGSLLSLDQSILLVWPHVVVLFALTHWLLRARGSCAPAVPCAALSVMHLPRARLPALRSGGRVARDAADLSVEGFEAVVHREVDAAVEVVVGSSCRWVGLEAVGDADHRGDRVDRVSVDAEAEHARRSRRRGQRLRACGGVRRAGRTRRRRAGPPRATASRRRRCAARESGPCCA